jgi:hypothetical protein
MARSRDPDTWPPILARSPCRFHPLVSREDPCQFCRDYLLSRTHSDTRRPTHGHPAIGRAAIARLHGEWVRSGGDRRTLVVPCAGGSGDLAWCLPRYSEGAVTGNGTTLAVFERRPSGDWLVRLCSLNGFPEDV